MGALVGNFAGITDARQTSEDDAVSLGTPGHYVDIAAMDTRLAAINAGYYTAAKLEQMSYNDKVFAIRTADDAASI